MDSWMAGGGGEVRARASYLSENLQGNIQGSENSEKSWFKCMVGGRVAEVKSKLQWGAGKILKGATGSEEEGERDLKGVKRIPLKTKGVRRSTKAKVREEALNQNGREKRIG